MFWIPLLITLTATTSAARPPDILKANIDTSVSPGADFFQYANGNWLKHNPIPKAETNWGIGNLVRDELYKRLRAVNEDPSNKTAPEGSEKQKIGDFWRTALDEGKAERAGLDPIKEQLERIGKVNSVQDALDIAFELHQIGVGALFDVGVSQDEKHSDQMAVHMGQGGLGLPDREYYFGTEAGVVKARQEYVKYVADILQLAGESDSANAATQIMNFETGLAKVSRKLEDLRDPESNYNKMSLDEAQKLDPSIAWKDRLAAWEIHPDFAIVGQPEFFQGLESLLSTTPVPVLRSYLRFHLVSASAPFLTKKADALNFHFFHQVLSGQKVPQPRWMRVMAAEDDTIGFIVGKIFVQDYFPPASKKRYSDLVDAIRNAYSKRIDRLDWMSPETKAKAHEKLAALVKKVGYPDHWKDYSALKIGTNSYCENVMNAARWNFQDNLSKLGKPVDRAEWGITPQTFNAYYNPSNNEIVLPAAAFAIPGFKDSDIDEAMMYGNAGASWIGHEMTHGFDDDGRHFDAVGNLTDWWTKNDADEFQKRAQVMVDQFNEYEPIPRIHINGKACLGENIADYGGLLLGIDAFHESESYKSGKKINGLTPIQRFFLAYDLSWLHEQTIESIRRQLLSDVHAPAKYRVNGPLSNIPEFYEAFGIKPGDAMWRAPEKRPNIW
jgi:putative endopeptidase